MEEAPQLAHRQEEIRRQQHDRQASRQADAPARQLRHRHHHAQRRAAIGDNIHDGDGIELHRQHLHRDLPEILGGGVHLLMALFIRLIDLQRRQTLQILKERIAQRGILAPIAGEQFLCPRLHRRDGDRNQRHADKQHDRRAQADRRKRRKERHRREHRIKKLRQVCAEVSFQLIDAFHSDLNDLRSLHLAVVRRAQRKQLFVNAVPQRLFDRFGREEAHTAHRFRADETHHQRRQQDERRNEQTRRRHIPRIQRAQRLRDRAHRGDIDQQPRPLNADAGGNISAALRHHADEPFIHHHILHTPVFQTRGYGWGSAPSPGREPCSLHPFLASRRF